MRLPDEPEAPLAINVVPLIDVMFALLTFFIMSTLFLTRSEGLPVNLPKAATAKMQQTSKVVITVNPKGEISLNRKPIKVEQIALLLKPLVASTQQSVVVINADEKVEHGQVIAIMDQVRQVEGAKLAIATRRP